MTNEVIKVVRRLLVEDKGRIVPRGDFASLCRQPGIFQDMHRGILK